MGQALCSPLQSRNVHVTGWYHGDAGTASLLESESLRQIECEP